MWKNFQVLTTVNYQDTAISVILIYMTMKMMQLPDDADDNIADNNAL